MKKPVKYQKRNVMVVGATSSLAHTLCHRMAKRGWNLLLAGRDGDELQALRKDLVIRYGINVDVAILDLSDPGFVPEPTLFETTGIGEINTLVIAAGERGDDSLRSDSYEIDRMVRINYLSPIKILAAFADRIEERRAGSIVVVSAVSGERGRQSNYTYGSCKGALSLYAAGLRARLFAKGCHVMTVKPGLVDTPMTYNRKSALITPREKVADMIVAAMDKKIDILYAPSYWRYIMLAVSLIPESIFKKMNI